MRGILLFGGRGIAVFDEEDLALVKRYTWCLVNGAAAARIGDETLYMHRLIMQAPRGVWVDHVNRDRLDNRRSNLRFCTRQQNQWNSGPREGRRYKGLYHVRFLLANGTVRERWQSKIRVGGKVRHLGTFFTLEDAARAYDTAALAAQGQFAHLNFPAAK